MVIAVVKMAIGVVGIVLFIVLILKTIRTPIEDTRAKILTIGRSKKINSKIDTSRVTNSLFKRGNTGETLSKSMSKSINNYEEEQIDDLDDATEMLEDNTEMLEDNTEMLDIKN